MRQRRLGCLLIIWGLLCTTASAQSPGQQIAGLRLIDPGISAVGVLSGTLSDKRMEDFIRAGMQLNVKVTVARPKDPKEIGALYKKLVSENNVKFVILPEASDPLVLGLAFEYLREQVMKDKVCICVVKDELVGKGAFCSMSLDNGKLRILVDQRLAQIVGVGMPSESGGAASFVAR